MNGMIGYQMEGTALIDWLLTGAAAVLVIVLFYRYVLKGGHNKEIPKYHISLALLLDHMKKIEPECFIAEYKKQWGTDSALGSNPLQLNKDPQVEEYPLGDGKNSMIVSYVNKPFSTPDLMSAMCVGFNLQDKEKERFVKHTSVLYLDYLIGSKNAFERVQFSAQAIITLSRLMPEAAGYMNHSAFAYRPISYFSPFQEKTSLDNNDLLLLFVNIHLVSRVDGSHYMHSHGMEQFGLPDLQVNYTDKNKDDYYFELLSNASLYLMDKGPVMKVGHTMELMGDGIIYEIRSVKDDPSHPFGEFGVLEFVGGGSSL